MRIRGIAVELPRLAAVAPECRSLVVTSLLGVRRIRVTTIGIALLIAACSPTTPIARSSSAPASQQSPAASDMVLVPDSVRPSGPIPSSTLPAVLPAKPTATTIGAANWSLPEGVGQGGDCTSVAAAIDENSTYHIAATCDGSIRYSVREADRSWSSTTFKHAANRQERNPQIAFAGNTLYLAYSRVALVEGGCGNDGTSDVGVHYRSRTLPDGAWSGPNQIGRRDDALQSFRVSGGTIHATVQNASDGRVYYETLQGNEGQRYVLEDAVGGTSLRVGSDGRARIAYEAADGLQYATFTGSGFSISAIAGSDRGWRPQLVLGKGNQPYLVWQRSYHGGGCADGALDPDQGVYYATNENGTWESARFTTDVGAASLTLDVATGRAHIVVVGSGGGDAALSYHTKSATGPWSTTNLTMPAGVSLFWIPPVIRFDPATGSLLVVFAGQGSPGGPAEIFATTKP